MAHLSCPLIRRAQNRSHGDSTSLPGLGPENVTSCFPVSASFSSLAPGSQSPLLWLPPEVAAASYEPLSCLGPGFAPGVQWGPWPHPASSSGTRSSDLHAGPPVHLSLKQQEHMNEAPRRPGHFTSELAKVPATHLTGALAAPGQRGYAASGHQKAASERAARGQGRGKGRWQRRSDGWHGRA